MNTSQFPIRCDIRVPVRLPKTVIRTIKSFEILEGCTQVWGGEDTGSLLRRSYGPGYAMGMRLADREAYRQSHRKVISLTWDTLLSVGGRS